MYHSLNIFRAFDSLNGTAKMKTLNIVEEDPTWEDIEAIQVKRIEFTLNPNLDLLNIKVSMPYLSFLCRRLYL